MTSSMYSVCCVIFAQISKPSTSALFVGAHQSFDLFNVVIAIYCTVAGKKYKTSALAFCLQANILCLERPTCRGNAITTGHFLLIVDATLLPAHLHEPFLKLREARKLRRNAGAARFNRSAPMSSFLNSRFGRAPPARRADSLRKLRAMTAMFATAHLSWRAAISCVTRHPRRRLRSCLRETIVMAACLIMYFAAGFLKRLRESPRFCHPRRLSCSFRSSSLHHLPDARQRIASRPIALYGACMPSRFHHRGVRDIAMASPAR